MPSRRSFRIVGADLPPALRPPSSLGNGIYTTPHDLRGNNLGGPDNLLSGSRSDERPGNEPRVERMPGLQVGLLQEA